MSSKTAKPGTPGLNQNKSYPMEYLQENDEQFICAFHHDSYHLYMYNAKHPKLAYQFFIGENLLFQGDDHTPSPLFDVDSVENMVHLLGFLTVQPGGVEEDYFANYTPDQMDWAASIDCEKLGSLVTDFEAAEDPAYKEAATAYFRNGFIRGYTNKVN